MYVHIKILLCKFNHSIHFLFFVYRLACVSSISENNISDSILRKIDIMNNYTVSEINDVVKKALHVEFRNKTVTITGEISNIKPSGRHTYLTLKDDNTSIQVVFWGSHLDNKHGDNVEIAGRIEYYVKNGNVNLIGTSIKNIGIGSLHTEYEKIKNDYNQKGYFNNRKPLPSSVKKIGIVTSEGGAAIRDFLYVLENNGFSGDVYVYDCIVQGSRCPISVAAGVKFFNSPFFVESSSTNSTSSSSTNTDIIEKNTIKSKSKKQIKDSSDSIDSDPFEISDNVKAKAKSDKVMDKFINDSDETEVDLIVVTRGGGSFEDLMGFSHPKVIDAIYHSKKYTISAVGHEIDNMLSDFAANYRASTPTNAAEVVSSINDNNRKQLTQLERKVFESKHTMIQELHKFKKNLGRLSNSVVDPTKKIEIKLNTTLERATSHIKDKLIKYQRTIRNMKELLNKNDVNKILSEGFIILTDNNGIIINNIQDVFDNNVIITHSDGQYEVIIKKINKDKPPESAKNNTLESAKNNTLESAKNNTKEPVKNTTRIRK